MKQVVVYELGDKVKVIRQPAVGGNIPNGSILTVVEDVKGYRWIDETEVQLRELNAGQTNGYQFEFYVQPPYVVGDKVKVTATPFPTSNIKVGMILDVVETIPGHVWIDTKEVEVERLNNDDKSVLNGYQFELYVPPVMANSEFVVGQVVKCESIGSTTYGLCFQVGEHYTVGVDCFGDTGPLDELGYTLRAVEDGIKFSLVTPAEEAPSEFALELEVERLTALVSKLTDEVLQLRGVIGKVEDILSEA